MGQLLNRFGQEAGLILLVGLVVIVIATLLVAWRMRTGEAARIAIWRSILEAMIVGALAGIAALTLGPFAGGGAGPVNLVPFQALLDNLRHGDFYVQLALTDLAANFLLYLPLGLLVGLRLPRLRVWIWALAVLVLSGGIEATQGLVLNRSADITDALMNAAGGVAGYLAGRLALAIAGGLDRHYEPATRRRRA